MKKLVFLLPLFFLLTSCASSTPNLEGQVVTCAEVELLPSESKFEPLDCLDGSLGFAVDLIKGPAIVNVWGSWCAPCRDEIPYFRDFYAQMDPSIKLIGVDVEEQNTEDGRQFVRDFGITWPNLYDSDGSTRKYFGMGVPVTWFIGSDGEAIYKHIGPIKSLSELRELSRKHLGVS
jgi:thiol-disulfide isomerase/thioredoxin